jgi:AraC-like DNA-binding protein
LTNYYKYLPTSAKDESWGLYVLNAGCNRIKRQETYPSSNHPAHHYFDWNKGRILNEYQLIYITNGTGVFESFNCGQHTINAGTVIFLFPGEWHRFRPSKETGWDEFWVGFKGHVIDNIIQQNFFTKENAVLEIGLHDIIIRLLSDIIEKTKEEKTGYQPLVAGIVMHFLGVIHSLTKHKSYSAEDKTEAVIERARMILRSNIVENIAMEKVAEELNVSYAWFRKAFKAYTGIAPHQYLIQLRIEKAKEYLSNVNLSVKEIAQNLNFESTFYFSRLFKEKTSLSPEIYRKSLADKD